VTRLMLARFDSLRCLSDEGKRRIRPSIRHHLLRYLWYVYSTRLRYYRVSWVVLILFNLGMISLSALVVHRLIGVFPSSWMLPLLVTSMASFLAALAPRATRFPIRIRSVSHREQPHSALIYCMVRMLYLTEKYPGRWSHERTRNELLFLLEHSARCFEIGFPATIRTHDAVSSIWLQTECQQMAAGMRDLKKLVLNPGQETRTKFLERVADTLLAAATGEWDAIERGSSAGASDTLVWRLRAIHVARTLVVGLAPILTFVSLQHTVLLPDPNTHELLYTYMQVGTVAWALLVLLRQLDPLYRERLQDIAQFVPGIQKSKE
jgi:hypothetical protein